MKKADSWCLFFSTFSNLRLIFDFHYSPLSFMIQHLYLIFGIYSVLMLISPFLLSSYCHNLSCICSPNKKCNSHTEEAAAICMPLAWFIYFLYTYKWSYLHQKGDYLQEKKKLWPAWTDGKTPAIDWGQCAEYYAFITSLHLQTGGESNVAHANHAPVPMSAHLGVLLCCSANTVWLAVFGGLRVGGGVSIY